MRQRRKGLDWITCHLEEDGMNERRIGGHVTQVETAVIGQRRIEIQRPEMRINEFGLDPRIGSVWHLAHRQQFQVIVTFADPRHL